MLTDPRTLPAVVVCLTHLPKQWERELHRFLPKLRTHIVQKGTPYDLRSTGDEVRDRKNRRAAERAAEEGRKFKLTDAEAGKLPDVVIINYHKLAGWADVLAEMCNLVIYDEVQELRRRMNARREVTGKYEAAEKISNGVSFRLGMSATPIYNYGGEMHSVISLLRPDALGTRSEFLIEWCHGGDENAQVTDPKAFGSYLRSEGIMLRRTRADVGRELPAVSRVVHHVDADTAAIDAVAGAAAELARVILSQNPLARGEKWKAAEELSFQLRQATGIAKAPYVADFVRLLVESGEKVLLYGWHREVYALWVERLKDLAPALYTGSESAAQKEKERERFLAADGTNLMIMSLRAGAGLDGLQRVCRTTVFGELDWSPGVHEQCIGRIDRDGQGEPVTAYFLIADSGSDPVVADVLGVKSGQIEGIRDPNADLVEALTVPADHVQRMAEAFLRQRGLSLPETPAVPAAEKDPAHDDDALHDEGCPHPRAADEVASA